MPRNGHQTLADWLPTELRRRYRHRTKATAAWQQAWRQAVSSQQAAHSRPVLYIDGLLTVQVDTAVWGTQLRHQCQRLLPILRQTPVFTELKEIKLQVRPPSRIPQPESVHQPRPQLSTAARRVLRDLATDIQDPELRRALKRLSDEQ